MALHIIIIYIGRAEKGRAQYNIIPVSGADPPADYDTNCHNDSHCQNSEQRSGYGNGHYLRVTLPFFPPRLRTWCLSSRGGQGSVEQG